METIVLQLKEKLSITEKSFGESQEKLEKGNETMRLMNNVKAILVSILSIGRHDDDHSGLGYTYETFSV